jgi:hypothetical protein
MPPTLEAPRALRRRLDKIRRNEGLHAFLKSVEQRSIEQRLPPKKFTPRLAAPKTEVLSDPTPERAGKAIEVAKAPSVPFNSQILGAAQKYAKQLGPEAMLILEQFYSIGIRGMNSRGLTASYDGFKVDVSRTSYEHLGASERDAHEQFMDAMARMPPELRRIAVEMVLETPPDGKVAPRKPVEIGEAVSGYTDHRRAHGAAVALLRAISWCIQPALGSRRRK